MKTFKNKYAVKWYSGATYVFCFSAYHRPSVLYHAQYTISSQEGPQQGDPIGPLLFCNTIHPMLSSLSSELNIGYLDDLSLGGPPDTVASDIATIVAWGSEMGLRLNIVKCELIAREECQISDPTLQSFTRVPISESTLLGAPLFVGRSLDEHWSKRCDDLARAIDRLRSIGSQEALTLLRASFSAPRVIHLLRCSPSLNHPALARFDNLLRAAIHSITNSDLSDTQWLQASLPVADGGIGVRRVASLALPAFMASAAGTLPLQTELLGGNAASVDVMYQTYLLAWTSEFGDLSDIPSFRQSTLDQLGIRRDRAIIQSSLSSQSDQAAFLAASHRHSGDWLHALPISSCGLKLDNEAVRVAVCLRLGLPLCETHSCQCRVTADRFGVHG